jgi:hypothetical protein
MKGCVGHISLENKLLRVSRRLGDSELHDLSISADPVRQNRCGYSAPYLIPIFTYYTDLEDLRLSEPRLLHKVIAKPRNRPHAPRSVW